MKKTIDELKGMITDYIGDRTDDASIELIEAAADTLQDIADAEARIRELDESWRKRYMDRFRGIPETEEEVKVTEDDDREDYEKVTVKDILKEE